MKPCPFHQVLYIHPIKQGLKLYFNFFFDIFYVCSLHTSNKTRIETLVLMHRNRIRLHVLYIHPIKQGLKRNAPYFTSYYQVCSLHTSNKTRIETLANERLESLLSSSLHTSNKTRIETIREVDLHFCSMLCSLHTSNKTRIET